jgi:O-antigen/teichoic acid export membrane protein
VINKQIGKPILVKLVNVLLRSGSLFAKLGLILFISKYLNINDAGYFGVFAATIMFGISFVGLEFYAYSTRELLSNKKDQWDKIVRNSVFFYCIAYAITIPVTTFLFVLEILPIKFAFFFYSILVFEHVSLEFSRLYIALSKNIFASVLIFIRTTLWVAVLLPCLIWIPESRSIDFVLLFWLIGSLLSSLSGWFIFSKDRRKFRADNIYFTNSLDFNWIFRGFKYSFFIYFSSQAVVLIYTLDKYYVQNYSGLEFVSVYVLFLGTSNALISFLESAVFVFYYPKLVTAFSLNDKLGFEKCAYRMFFQVVLLSLVFCSIVYIIMPYLLNWIDKEDYFGNTKTLVILLCAGGVKALSMTQHYLLYATRNDRYNNWSNFTSLVVFVICVYILHGMIDDGLYAVGIGMFVTFLYQFIYKYVVWNRVRKYSFKS